MDWLLIAVLVGSFAAFLTAHCSLAVGLLIRAPRWRGAVAFVVPPLAPYWGYTSGMRRRAVLWFACLVLYGASLIGAYAVGGP